MADQKISELTSYLDPEASDLLPIVDVTASETKSITFEVLTQRPHAMLSDGSVHAVAATTEAYAVTYADHDVLFGVSHVADDSKVYVSEDGTYTVGVRLTADTSNGQTALLDLWLRVNGVNLAKSTRQVALGSTAMAAELVVDVSLYANDYVELYYHGSTTAVRLVPVAAQVTPVVPAAPSVVLTVKKVSA